MPVKVHKQHVKYENSDESVKGEVVDDGDESANQVE